MKYQSRKKYLLYMFMMISVNVYGSDIFENNGTYKINERVFKLLLVKPFHLDLIKSGKNYCYHVGEYHVENLCNIPSFENYVVIQYVKWYSTMGPRYWYMLAYDKRRNKVSTLTRNIKNFSEFVRNERYFDGKNIEVESFLCLWKYLYMGEGTVIYNYEELESRLKRNADKKYLNILKRIISEPKLMSSKGGNIKISYWYLYGTRLAKLELKYKNGCIKMHIRRILDIIDIMELDWM